MEKIKEKLYPSIEAKICGHLSERRRESMNGLNGRRRRENWSPVD